MKRKIGVVAAVLALAATAVAAVALGAVGNSGISLEKKQLAATAAVDGVEAGDPGSPSMEISSWSWGVSNSGSASSGGGGGAGKATLANLNVTKVIDKASPRLALFAATGQHIPTVTLTVLRPGGSTLPYLEIKLTDAIVASVQDAGAGDPQPQERVSFDYRRVELKYIAVDGTSTQAAINEASSS
jgi:type VI secretion system secreted protein Hcp